MLKGKLRFFNSRGQAMVEFTLVFLLLLVIAWIPADFGLAFYTGQLALNASREGARIAAAERGLVSGTNTDCTLPCSSAPAGSVLHETARRLSSALLPEATIRLCYPVTGVNPATGACTMGTGGTTCNQQLAVVVTGNYNYFFLGFLNYFGAPVPASAPITRVSQMRWEHQSSCF